ncbi:hypothetical protein CYD30_10075 [Kosakonia cowanii]|nr:hypothetical protein CYD30_10075 [Kosakonia cowanii]
MTIFEYVSQDPGKTSTEIARAMGKSTSVVTGSLSRMRYIGRILDETNKEGVITWRVNDLPFGCSNRLIMMFNQLLREVRQ